ncbi:MAG: hypothetical protein IJ226_00505, partial [Clostridia bacterium]|nr:hypothetical protein [Clostridia bacterium]
VAETLTAEEQAYIEEIREKEPEEFDAVEEILEEAEVSEQYENALADDNDVADNTEKEEE